MNRIAADPRGVRVRRDVIEAVKRKWIAGLPPAVSSKDSVPSNRSKYERKGIIQAPPHAPVNVDSSSDDFGDEFSDGEVIHSSEAARKLAALPMKETEPLVIKSKVKVAEVAKPPAESVEELSDSLENSEYEAIPEPSQCDIRVFGQTEICEAGDGSGRKGESSWMVTVLNGFIQTQDEPKVEIIFRTSSDVYRSM